MQGWERSCEILDDVVKLGLLDSALEDAFELLGRLSKGIPRRWTYSDESGSYTWVEFSDAGLEGHACKIIE